MVTWGDGEKRRLIQREGGAWSALPGLLCETGEEICGGEEPRGHQRRHSSPSEHMRDKSQPGTQLRRETERGSARK